MSLRVLVIFDCMQLDLCSLITLAKIYAKILSFWIAILLCLNDIRICYVLFRTVFSILRPINQFYISSFNIIIYYVHFNSKYFSFNDLLRNVLECFMQIYIEPSHKTNRYILKRKFNQIPKTRVKWFFEL